MSYKVLDISRDPASQGFAPHSFDMIIASNVLHATQSLRETMKHCRQLLKPGGHMLLLEITSLKQTWISFIFGTVPGWWEGAEIDGRTLGPTATISEWEVIMKDVGFSALESCTEQTDDHTIPLSVFSARAMDPTMALIEAPLIHPQSDRAGPLVVIGGLTSNSKPFLASLEDTLGNRVAAVVPSFADIHDVVIPKHSTFVVLSELDNEFFANLDEDSFEGVKAMFYYARNVLWLTEDAYTQRPFQLMVQGMCRTLRLEYPDCQLQLLDLNCAANIDPQVIVSTLLTLEASQDLDQKHVLWTTEGELRMIDGQIHVPRLKPDTKRNQRYNSKRRRITSSVDTSNHPVELRKSATGFDLFSLDNMLDPMVSSDDLLAVNVSFSTLYAVKISASRYLFPVAGHIIGTGAPVIALTTKNCSTVHVPVGLTIQLGLGDLAVQLSTFVANVLAKSMLAAAPKGSTLLVHEPSAAVAQALLQLAPAEEVLVTISRSTLTSSSQSEGSCLVLHPKATQKALRQSMPRNVFAYFDMHGSGFDRSLSRRIQSCLPTSCDRFSLAHFYQERAMSLGTIDLSKTIDMNIFQALRTTAVSPVAIEEITGSSATTATTDVSTIVDWRMLTKADVRAEPVDSINLFNGNGTYVLVGLTGDLGRSLCRWMIEHGARYVVLLSRNPKISAEWLEMVSQSGATVETRAMYVTHTLMSIDHC
jgi:hypothetical protein